MCPMELTSGRRKDRQSTDACSDMSCCFSDEVCAVNKSEQERRCMRGRLVIEMKWLEKTVRSPDEVKE